MGVIFIGDPDPQEFLPGPVLRASDSHWRALFSEAARLATRIIVIPESSSGIEFEMRALASSELLGKVVVCVPPDPHLERAAEWAATVARYSELGFSLPPQDSRGLIYRPRDDFSIAVGPRGQMCVSIGHGLENLDAALSSVAPKAGEPEAALRDVMPRLLALEKEPPALSEPLSFDLLLAGATIRLLRAACDQSISGGSRTLAADALRHLAGLSDMSDTGFQQQLVDLRRNGALTLRGDPVYEITVSVAAFEWFIKDRLPYYRSLRIDFDKLRAVEPRIRSNTVADRLGVPLRVADHLFEVVAESGLERIVKTADGELRFRRYWELWG